MDNISLLFIAPVLNLQLLIDGLLIGAIFALSAYGLALVWGVMNVKNLAQGEFVIMGGYIAWYLSTVGIHPIFGLPVSIVLMFGFGWLMYLLIIKWVIGRDLFTSLLATFGLALVIQQLQEVGCGGFQRDLQSVLVQRLHTHVVETLEFAGGERLGIQDGVK